MLFIVRNVVCNRLVVVVIVAAASSRRRLLGPSIDCGRLWPVWPIVVAASSRWISISLVLCHCTNSRHARSALQPTPAHRTSLGCTNDDRRHNADDWLADLRFVLVDWRASRLVGDWWSRWQVASHSMFHHHLSRCQPSSSPTA